MKLKVELKLAESAVHGGAFVSGLVLIHWLIGIFGVIYSFYLNVQESPDHFFHLFAVRGKFSAEYGQRSKAKKEGR